MSTDAYSFTDNPSRSTEARLSRREFGRVSLLCMLTGSTVFGRGQPKDIDYIAIGTVRNVNMLLIDGWEHAGSMKPDGEFVALDKIRNREEDGFISLKKGDENIILTGSPVFVERWIAAHDECCERRPYTRAERVAIFRKHLYGEQPQ